MRKVTETKRQALIARFVHAISGLRTEEEAAAFLTDLLTRHELDVLAKRLTIADRLIAGNKYEDIATELGAGFTTIGRVSEWLAASGAGFRKAYSHKKELAPPARSRRLNRFNWPLVLVEELLNSSDKTQRKRIEKILNQVDRKNALYKELQEIQGRYPLVLLPHTVAR